MTRRQRNELVEARADLILAGELTSAAYADYFEAQMHRGTVRKLLSHLRVFRRAGVVMLAAILAAGALLCYAAADRGPLMLAGADGLVAVDAASGRLVTATQLAGTPGAVSGGDGSVWVADPGAGQVSRIDPSSGAAKISPIPATGGS